LFLSTVVSSGKKGKTLFEETFSFYRA